VFSLSPALGFGTHNSQASGCFSSIPPCEPKKRQLSRRIYAHQVAVTYQSIKDRVLFSLVTFPTTHRYLRSQPHSIVSIYPIHFRRYARRRHMDPTMSSMSKPRYLPQCSEHEYIHCTDRSEWEKEKNKLRGRVRRVLLEPQFTLSWYVRAIESVMSRSR
jgi:arginyl-tRNA--protein-N-Asp/Glu arginylyltransferase